MWIKLWPARRLDEDGGSGYKAAKYTQHLRKAFSGRGGTQCSSVCAYVKCVRALLWLSGVFSGCQSQAVSQKLLASTQAIKLWCFRRVQGFGKTQNSVFNRHWGCPYLSKLGVRSLEFFILFFSFSLPLLPFTDSCEHFNFLLLILWDNGFLFLCFPLNFCAGNSVPSRPDLIPRACPSFDHSVH